MDDDTEEYCRAAIQRARDEHGSDDIEIDDDAKLSQTDEGTWVQAWVYVADPEPEGEAK